MYRVLSSLRHSHIMSRGLLIVVEGCDRSGKSTQCARLTDRLNANGHNTKLLKFPGKLQHVIGLVITFWPHRHWQQIALLKRVKWLTDTLSNRAIWTTRLFISCFQLIGGKPCKDLIYTRHIQLVHTWQWIRDAMEQMLKSGTHLVVDRYAFSGVAFSSAKVNKGMRYISMEMVLIRDSLIRDLILNGVNILTSACWYLILYSSLIYRSMKLKSVAVLVLKDTRRVNCKPKCETSLWH